MNRQLDTVSPVANEARTGPGEKNSLEPKTMLSVLAAVGIFAPILFTFGVVVQSFLRTDLRLGYSSIAQEVSDLTAGPMGWVQQVNFVVFGLLMIMFAAGLRWGVRAASPWMIGPALVAWNGIELVIAGVFPRRESSTGLIYDPLGVHMANGMIFFLSIGIVLIMLSLRFARDTRWRDLAIYTRVSGIALFVMSMLNGILAEAPTDPLHPWLGLIQRAILTMWFLCIVVLALRLRRVGKSAHDADMRIAIPSTTNTTRARPNRGSPPPVPRWVIVLVIIVLLLVVVVVTIENLTRHDMGNMQMFTPEHMLAIVYKGQML